MFGVLGSRTVVYWVLSLLSSGSTFFSWKVSFSGTFSSAVPPLGETALFTMTLESGWRGSVVNFKKVIIRDAVKTTQGLLLLKICAEFSTI